MPRTGLTSRPVLALAMPLLRSNFFVSSMVDFRNASSTVVGWLSSNSTPPLLTFCQNWRAFASFFSKVPYIAATIVWRLSSGVLMLNISPTHLMKSWGPVLPKSV